MFFYIATKNKKMPVFTLNDKPEFPPPQFADASGLLCEGGKLEYEWVKKALLNGFFMYTHPLRYPKWWTPDPRTVIDLNQWEGALTDSPYEIEINENADEILGFFQKKLNQQPMTYDWLTGIYKNVLLEFDQTGERAFLGLYEGDDMKGGMFGIVLGKVYFGEFAFFTGKEAMQVGVNHMLSFLKKQNIKLLDLTKPTNMIEHEMMDQIPRDIFLSILKSNL